METVNDRVRELRLDTRFRHLPRTALIDIARHGVVRAIGGIGPAGKSPRDYLREREGRRHG